MKLFSKLAILFVSLVSVTWGQQNNFPAKNTNNNFTGQNIFFGTTYDGLLNNTFYVGPVYVTPQAAVTAACAVGSVRNVEVPPGTATGINLSLLSGCTNVYVTDKRAYIPLYGTWGSGIYTFTSGGGGGGGLSSVGLTMPTWLGVSNSPLTSNGTIAVTAATGQTSHQVIGTCGTATSFAPCALVAGDIPSLPYLSSATVLPSNTPGVSHQALTAYNSSTGGFSQAQLAFSDISGTASTGQIPALPYLSNSTVLPVTVTRTSHNFLITYDSTTGLYTQAQPLFSDLSGTATSAQLPQGSSSAIGGLQCGSGTSCTSGVISVSAGSGTITSSPKFQLPFYSATGTANTLTGDSGIVTDGSGDLTVNQLTSLGTAGVGGGGAMVEGTATSGVASSDIIYALASNHRLTMNLNNGGALSMVGIGTAAASGNCAKFASNGIDLVDQGSTCGGTQVYPGAGIAVSTGTAWGTSDTTSGTGTILALTVSPSFTTPTLGVASATSVTLTGTTAGFLELAQGTTNTAGTTSIKFQAPASVTSQLRTFTGTPATGFELWTNTAGSMAETLIGSTGSGNVVLATSPTLVTPALGTPTALVLTAATGLPMTTGVTGILAGTNGGTGVNNAARTITIAGNLSHTGAFTQTFIATANTSLTLPTSGTLSNLGMFSCGTTTTCSATAQNLPKVQWGSATLAAGTATVTGLSAYTSTSSFGCVAQDNTSILTSARAAPASTTSITLTGTGTDVVQYVCTGN